MKKTQRTSLSGGGRKVPKNVQQQYEKRETEVSPKI